ncbi:hypothetical protein F5887DRAFT_1073535 [Amanita rubescens]|nr:hypothetical protein F5887DRAFT_1073535 [Amanita rubescens]
MASKETLARMESASDDVAKGQIYIQNLYGYLSFVANLPANERAFVNEHRLSPAAANEMNTDIEEIVKNYSVMRDDCSQFENETFEAIIEMGENMKIYANGRQTQMEIITGEIESFDWRESREYGDIIQGIRDMARNEPEELDEEIVKAKVCQKGINKFHQQTRGHLAEIRWKQAHQEIEATSEQDCKAELSSHVKFIKEQATVYEKAGEKAGNVDAKFWVHFVGLVPCAFYKDPEFGERIKIIQSSASGEFTREKLCLYRELIKDSLEQVTSHIEKAHEVVGKFEGIFRVFSSEIKIMRNQLRNFQGKTEEARLQLRHSIRPFWDALNRLEKSGKS